jgi:hypothetical protein
MEAYPIPGEVIRKCTMSSLPQSSATTTGLSRTGANGRGVTKEEAKESLSQAIALILEDRRSDQRKEIALNSVCEIQLSDGAG